MADLMIYKYPFSVTEKVILEMPKDAHILTIQSQRECPCFWAIVNPCAPVETREFRTFATGEPIDIDIQKSKYIGTFQLLNGRLVGHVFEVNRG